ncbi:MAG: malto-oligosyltrehalose trehalohydrolase [Candidatus Eremiobacteraeota bacterium]|nr:malto-oligosyltrehalose trehalohydrolase [Candidatus Eremiobacteraeota bacterium]
MPFGAEVLAGGGVRFAVWAPSCAQMGLAVEGEELPRALQQRGDGWHELVADDLGPGARYRFALPDGTRVPDPASRFQPDDVHGPSEVIDPCAYRWADGAWRGLRWAEGVVYELHVGAFTPEGTFAAATGRLDHLVALGVTAVELMPLGAFPGRRGWGYDGVFPYAPEASYGRPDDVKRFIEEAHARRLAVILDVVYNHFGPEGNYLSLYAPAFFTKRHTTPWGDAIDYGNATVRAFAVENALYWVDEYHLDGLRLDAVHAIVDDSPVHVLDELAARVRAVERERPIHLILENEENEARRLVRDADGRPRAYDAQWNDDVHHVLHVAATGERSGYYADYTGRADLLARALAEGFAFQGQIMPYRRRSRGEPSAWLPPDAFVAFAQNHDQVGNRAFGERLDTLAPAEAVRAVAATYLLLPQVPMLFMGEEWATDRPFPFFCDFGPDLADAVRDGRRNEFARFPEFADPQARARIPDPLAEATFLSAKLDWEAALEGEHARRLAWYRAILAVRRAHIVPLLPHLGGDAGCAVVHAVAVAVTWTTADRTVLSLAANLSAVRAALPVPDDGVELWCEGTVGRDGTLAPWTVRWTLQHAG